MTLAERSNKLVSEPIRALKTLALQARKYGAKTLFILCSDVKTCPKLLKASRWAEELPLLAESATKYDI